MAPRRFFEQPVRGARTWLAEGRGPVWPSDALTREFLGSSALAWPDRSSGLAWTPDRSRSSSLPPRAATRATGQITPSRRTAGHRCACCSQAQEASRSRTSHGTAPYWRSGHEVDSGMMAMLPGPRRARCLMARPVCGPILSTDGASILFTDQGGMHSRRRPFVSLRRPTAHLPSDSVTGSRRTCRRTANGRWPSSPDHRLARGLSHWTGEPITLANGPIERHIQPARGYPTADAYWSAGKRPAHPEVLYPERSGRRTGTRDARRRDRRVGVSRRASSSRTRGRWIMAGRDPRERDSSSARGLLSDIVAGWSSDGGSALVTAAWWNLPSRLERVRSARLAPGP